MTQVQIDFSQAISSGANPRDYFGRVTFGDPRIAADLLRYYTDLVQYVPDENRSRIESAYRRNSIGVIGHPLNPMHDD